MQASLGLADSKNYGIHADMTAKCPGYPERDIRLSPDFHKNLILKGPDDLIPQKID